jgi:hypothetical protein
METECSTDRLSFQPLGRREIRAEFDGGTITSDAGALLLREVEQRTGILKRFAACFTDHRNPELIEHTVEELIAQRVYALALGYEDLNDHDDLRHDPLLAVLVGKADPTGENRRRHQDQGKPLAGKSTLNRVELTPVGADAESRYKKVVASMESIERLLVDLFLVAFQEPPEQIVIDLDATDDPLYGHQLGRFFHGYYKEYCFLPLYVFCGEFLLAARLRPADIDASAGTVSVLGQLVEQIRLRWPKVRIVIRGDSGFCREPIMRWCEEHGVHFVFGLAKNPRLLALIEAELAEAESQYEESGQPSRVFAEFGYRTLKSWSRLRRVVAKAEHLAKGANPRFVVTSFGCDERDPCALYEDDYCSRGEMENRIKEQQLCLFADRTSCETMRANQLRLYFSSMAYVLMEALRRLGLKGTTMAKARCDTIRLKLLKLGAHIRITVRKVWIAFSEAYPYQQLFQLVLENLRRVEPVVASLRC